MPTGSNSVRTDNQVTSVSVSYASQRPWFDQWWVALWWLDQVERCYAGRSDGPRDTSGWRLIAQEACLAMCHVRDWLEHDPAVPLNGGQLRRIVERKVWLKLATDVANTSKHHTRLKGGVTARVGSVSVSGADVKRGVVAISWNDGQGQGASVDALALVRGAASEWRTVLADHGIADPYAQGV